MYTRLALVVSILLLASPLALAQGSLEIHFINVNQGDCTLISCPNGNKILVDCGSSGCSDQTGARDHILGELDPDDPELQALVITHPDKDHYNLLPTVLNGVSVENVVMAGKTSEYGQCKFDKWLETDGDWQTRLTYSKEYFDDLDEPKDPSRIPWKKKNGVTSVLPNTSPQRRKGALRHAGGYHARLRTRRISPGRPQTAETPSLGSDGDRTRGRALGSSWIDAIRAQ